MLLKQLNSCFKYTPLLKQKRCKSYLSLMKFDGLAGAATMNPEFFEGKALLMVNTASLCGLTPQLKEMELVHQRFKNEGLIVIGVPSNDFGAQEPWEESKVLEFYKTEYGVTFPLSSKQTFIGPASHPLYAALRADFGDDITPRWNFHKYLFQSNGDLVGVFGHIMSPTEVEITDAILETLTIHKDK